MRIWPFEHHTLKTMLTEDQIQTRLWDCTQPSSWQRPGHERLFVGRVDADEFRLVPLIRGQSSFLPQFFGRCRATSDGTLIDLQIVPNIALLICLLIDFAFMGILVYEKVWIRVLAITGANILLAGLLLLFAYWLTVAVARDKLFKILDVTSVPFETGPAKSSTNLWRIAAWILAATILATGLWLFVGVLTARLAISTRPAVDLVTIAWTTLGLLALWLFTASGVSPVMQVRCLIVLFAVEVGWSLIATVDGYVGDGRPMFVWRWNANNDHVDLAQDVKRMTTIEVDLLATTSHDVPAFRGAGRDGIVENVSLQTDWERHSPQIVWQQPIGIGWSSYAVANGFAVTQEQRGLDEAVVCYEVATGRECWEHRDRARFHEMMGGDGPRATPTLDEGDVYALGATGILNRLRGSDGSVVWSINIIQDAQAPGCLFGLTGSPLVWNDMVIVSPGGPKASLVAYDKQTGKRRWAAGTSPTAYASPQAVRLAGKNQILTFNADGLFAHATDDGQILWSHPWVTPPEFNNVCQPMIWRDDAGAETVFITSGYGKGCVLLDVTSDGDTFAVTPRWQNRNLKVKFSSVVCRDGYVFGLDENILTCLDLRTGQRCWKGGRYGFGQLLLADDTLLVLSDDGEVILCEATPDRHHELARLPVLNGRTWNHPTLSGKTLLIRNDRNAACLTLPLR